MSSDLKNSSNDLGFVNSIEAMLLKVDDNENKSKNIAIAPGNRNSFFNGILLIGIRIPRYMNGIIIAEYGPTSLINNKWKSGKVYKPTINGFLIFLLDLKTYSPERNHMNIIGI